MSKLDYKRSSGRFVWKDLLTTLVTFMGCVEHGLQTPYT